MANRKGGLERKIPILSVTSPHEKVTAQSTRWSFPPGGGTLKSRPGAEPVALLTECLPHMRGALDSIPSPALHKWGMVVYPVIPALGR